MSASKHGPFSDAEIRALVAEALPGLTVPGKRYPTPLPPELEPWYGYTVDGGHSILIVTPGILAAHENDAEGWPQGWLVAAPVKTVLRGYRLNGAGLIVCDVEYDDTLGLMPPEGDDEY